MYPIQFCGEQICAPTLEFSVL